MRSETEFKRAEESVNTEELKCSGEMRTILREFLADECLLTAKNQNTLCCYWDITEDCFARMALQRRVDVEDCWEAIRLTWQAQSLFDLNYRILRMSFTSCHGHLNVPFPGKIYQVEIGWICGDGNFIPILTSNQSCSH